MQFNDFHFMTRNAFIRTICFTFCIFICHYAYYTELHKIMECNKMISTIYFCDAPGFYYFIPLGLRKETMFILLSCLNIFCNDGNG